MPIRVIRIVSCLIASLLLVPHLSGQEDDSVEPSRAEVIGFYKEKLPRLASRLVDLRARDAEDFDEMLQEAREIVREYRHLREVASPQVARDFLTIHSLDHQIDGFAEQVHEAESDAARSEAKADLLKTVGLIYDLRLRVEEAELAVLRREVDERAAELRERRNEREARLREEVGALLDPEEEEEDEQEELSRAKGELERLKRTLAELRRTQDDDSVALVTLLLPQLDLRRQLIDVLRNIQHAAEEDRFDEVERLDRSAEPLRWRLEAKGLAFRLSRQRLEARRVQQAHDDGDPALSEESGVVIELHDKALRLVTRLDHRLGSPDEDDAKEDEEGIHVEKLAREVWRLSEYAHVRYELLVQSEKLATAKHQDDNAAIKQLTANVRELRAELGLVVAEESANADDKLAPLLELTSADLERAAQLNFATDVMPLLQTHCIDCHGPDTTEGEIDLVKEAKIQPFVKRSEVWEKVRAHLKNRVMPPEDASEMPELERRKVLAYFAWSIDEFDYSQIDDPGYEVSRRLTHAEYDNTVRDLLGIDLRLAQSFPAELTGISGFENSGNTLFLHRLLMERYFGAAEEVVQTALARDATDGDATARNANVFISHPSENVDEETAAREILGRFLMRAYRRPATDSELAATIGHFRSSRQAGHDFDDAIKAVLQMTLVSPKFLLRVERMGEGDAAYRISDWDLASRLSYFLWSSMPDEELFRAAGNSELKDSKALRRQVDRMIDDPKSITLGTTFAGQWLGSRILGVRMRPDPIDNPWCTDTLMEGLKAETALFFHSLLVDDQPISRLVDADYTYLNEEIAKHYRIKGVRGDEMRRVSLQGKQRGGIFGQGSLLAVTSFPGRTSPVVRGKWILTDVLGTPPPPPPPNVSDFSEEVAEKRFLSPRQKLQLHRRNPNCYTCHSQIDPLGFSLENYDWFGRWRSEIRGQPIDARGELPDGRKFEGPAGLKQVILQQRMPDLTRQLTRKLLSYALGRQLDYYDEPAVRSIIQTVAENNDQFRALIYAIVESYPFQYKKNPASQTGS